MELSLEPFELAPLIDAVVVTMRSNVEKNGNRLHVSYPKTLGAVVADPVKTRQVLINLLGNAGKFTTNGDVWLEVERNMERGTNWIQFVVRDNGIGITSEQMPRLFKPFSQADGSTTRKHGGTGLGLVISRRVCEMMGGTITATSTPGKLTTFTMRLPVDARVQASGFVLDDAAAVSL
jgi:signal transduction histidine kinase